jgi:hypothetical protein
VGGLFRKIQILIYDHRNHAGRIEALLPHIKAELILDVGRVLGTNDGCRARGTCTQALLDQRCEGDKRFRRTVDALIVDARAFPLHNSEIFVWPKWYATTLPVLTLG